MAGISKEKKIDEFIQNAIFEIFPNPSSDLSTIRFSVTKTSDVLIEVYSLNGVRIQTLYHAEVEAGKMYELGFNAASFAGGIYFAHMSSSLGEVHYRKLIIQ